VKKTAMPLLIAIAGYAMLAAALFYKIVFFIQVPGSPDSVTPMAVTMALDSLKAASGSYPLWQPWTFSGMPTVEAFSYLSGLYVPNALFGILNIDALHIQLIHLVFAGTGGFVLMKRLGMKDIASFFTGASFMLNPFMTAMLAYGHGSQLMTAAYMPWAIWATLRLCEENGSIQDAGMLTLILGLQLQRAHVQIAYYTWMLVLPLAVFAFSLALKNGRFPWKQGAMFIVALAAGVAMSASIYWPSIEYLPFSARSSGTGGLSAYDYATMWSMHPAELLTFLFPAAFGFGGITYWGFMPFTDFPQYAGIVVLVLAVAGTVAGRKKPVVWFFAGTAFLALLLAFGRHGGLIYNLFYAAAPLFSKFRVPSMALIIVFLNLAILGGYGIQAWIDKPLTEKSKVLKAASFVIAILIILFLFLENGIELFFRSVFPAPSVEQSDLAFLVDKTRWLLLRGSFFTSAVISALTAGVLWLAARKLLTAKHAALLIVALALGDLLWIDARIVYPGEQSLRPSPLVDRAVLRQAMEPDDITSFLSQQKGTFRIYPAGQLFTENKFSISGIESTGGYHPAKLRVYQDVLVATGNLANLNVLRMLNVGYVLSTVPVEHPALTLVSSGMMHAVSGTIPVGVYRLEGSMPRAWFAPEVTSLGSDAEAVEAIMQADQQHPAKVYVSKQPWRGTRSFSAGEMLLFERKPEKISLKVRTQGEAFLVLSEVYYPLHWKAAVDGLAHETIRVNGLVRGLILSPGTHDIVFSYDRGRFETGRGISHGALGFAAVMIAGGLLERKRKSIVQH
jgi:hypothetical protein